MIRIENMFTVPLFQIGFVYVKLGSRNLRFGHPLKT